MGAAGRLGSNDGTDEQSSPVGLCIWGIEDAIIDHGKIAALVIGNWADEIASRALEIGAASASSVQRESDIPAAEMFDTVVVVSDAKRLIELAASSVVENGTLIVSGYATDDEATVNAAFGSQSRLFIMNNRCSRTWSCLVFKRT